MANLDSENMVGKGLLSKGSTFAKKMLIFCKKKTGIDKIKQVVVLKDIFSETEYIWVLTDQFSTVYSIILTSSRQGGNFT